MADKNMQNNQINGNQELIVFLAKRFDGIDKRFDGIDEKFVVNDKRFDGIESRLAVFQDQYVADYQDLVGLLAGQFEKIMETKADKADIDRVLTRVATLGNKIDDYRAEQIGLSRHA